MDIVVLFNLICILANLYAVSGIIGGEKITIQNVPFVVYGQGEPREAYKFTGMILDTNLILTVAEPCQRHK